MLNAGSSNKQLVYCPGPNPQFKLVVNSYNVSEIPQEVTDKSIEAVSISAVAQEAQESEETVTSILGAIRDAVLELVKKNNVALNCTVGSLILRPNGQIEFKPSLTPDASEKQAVDDKIPYSAEFDKTTNLKQGSLI